MPPWFRALRVVIGLARGAPQRVRRRAIRLGAAARQADVYAPLGRPRGTLVFVHGMTMHGHRDPRQVAACVALSGAGLRVVAPLFPEIAAPRIAAASLDEVAQALVDVGEDPDHCPGGRLGIFSASFSASLCLLAATRPAVARHVGAILALGPYADLHECLAFVMGGAGVDPYGRTVLFRSLLHRALGPVPAVEAALAEALADDSLRRRRPLLPAALAALPAQDRALAERVLHDPAWCRAIAPRILAASTDLVGPLDLLPRVAAITCPVALVHGQDDDVIPPSQSAALHRVLRGAGRESRLLHTPLLTHGDTRGGPRALGPTLALVDLLAWYLARIPPLVPRPT